MLLTKFFVRQGIAFFLVVLTLSVSAFTYELPLNDIEQELATDLQRVAGDPALIQLHTYKTQVEEIAYPTTLKLCEGYRRATGAGPHPYHGHYMYSFEESMKEWGYILTQGAMQTFSAMFGDKANYIVLKNIGFFDFDSWFNSMYTLYLIQSPGFLQAAVHCLHTIDTKTLNHFAATLVIADNQASLATHIFGAYGVGMGVNGIFKILTKITNRSIWWQQGASYLKRVVWQRVRRPLVYITATGLTFGIGAIAYKKAIGTYLVTSKEAEIQNLLTTNTAVDFRHLLVAFEKLKKIDNCASRQCTSAQEDFLSYLQENFSETQETQLLQQVSDYKISHPDATWENTPIEIALTDIVFSQKYHLTK